MSTNLESTQATTDRFFSQRARRIIDLNDVFGSNESILQRPDPEAQITKLIRSGVEEFRREFDIFGREDAVPYIVAETARLLEELQNRPCFTDDEKARFGADKTLILANCEPRDEEGANANGNEFAVAKVGNRGLQVVGSPIALSAVKNLIAPGDLYRIPNDNDYYFPKGDQFRSASFELAAHKPEKLLPDSLQNIREPAWKPHLAYVDRFGNQKLRTADDDAFQNEMDRESIPLTKGIAKGTGARKIGLEISGTKLDFIVLGNGTLGSDVWKGNLVQYRNHTRGNVHNLVYGWTKGLTAEEKKRRSAHASFGEPAEGSFVSIR